MSAQGDDVIMVDKDVGERIEDSDTGLDKLDLDSHNADNDGVKVDNGDGTISEELIDLEALERILFKEINIQEINHDITTLPRNFYSDINKYLSSKEDGSINTKRRHQLKKLINLFVEFRTERIINHSKFFSASVNDRLSHEERDFYKNMCLMVEKFREGITSKMSEENNRDV